MDHFLLAEVEKRQKQERLAKHDQKVEAYFQQGPYVYELYSILIHQGSAQGGHFFAYIKSFETKKWYMFNDS
jgi:ubiquitin carboxyl-terminal hydrolase 47